MTAACRLSLLVVLMVRILWASIHPPVKEAESYARPGPHPVRTGAARPLSHDHAAWRQLLPWAGSELFSTLSSLKLPTFWLGGNSLNVLRNCPT